MVVAGRNGGVGCKDAGFPYCLEIPSLFVFFSFFQELEDHQTGMTLIHMVLLDPGITQFPKHPYSTDPQDDFLGKPVFFVAAIKIMGESPVRLAILL